MTRRPTLHRAGYVLVAVLWTVVAVTACALATGVAGREAAAAAGNRMALTRAAWLAEGCAARALAATDAALAGTAPVAAAALPGEPRGATAWRTLDEQLRAVLAPAGGCRIAVTPVDTSDAAEANGAAGAAGRPAPRRAGTAPDVWTLTTRASCGAPSVIAVLELRVARAGVRPAVVRRRTWVE